MGQTIFRTHIAKANPVIQEGINHSWGHVRNSLGKLHLRTKFLLSLVLVTAGLTCATLLVVRHSAQLEVQKHIEEDTRNAILTFQVVQHQRQLALSRKADLLATLALMRNGDATTIDDASEDPWRSDESDLFLVADRSGKVVALHTTISGFQVATAQELLHRYLNEGSTAGWWYSGRRLYQVVLQHFYERSARKSSLLGTVVVGREIDALGAKDLGRISSSRVAFRYGDEIAVSTFPAIEEHELEQQIQDQSAPKLIRIGNARFLASSLDLTPGSRPGVSLIVLKSYDEAVAFLQRLNHLLLGLGLVAVLAGGALVFLISDTFTRPLAALVEGVRALENGNFTYPLEAYGEDEVAHVTRAFDRMRGTLLKNEAQNQQLEDQLRQSQKMEALGRLAGGVAHDFNNLLTVIKGHNDMLLDGLKPEDASYRSSEQVRKAADRAASLTRQLLAFSRRQLLQAKVLDLNALIAEMGILLKRLVREDIEFVLQLGDSLGRVKGDPGQIEQVLLNLTVNACDAMPRGGKLTIKTRNVTVDADYARTHPSIEPGRYVLLAVTDIGHGMDAETMGRIFEPFFTTKEQGKGTGLGLATVYGVVKQSGGFIWVDSAPGRGACFEIYWPYVTERVERASAERITTPSRRAFETVLVVEDETEVRELAAEFLSSAGYNVLTAQDGAEALEIANRLGSRIHLLLTDVVMPRMRGPELAQRLKRLRPSLKVIFMSGYLEANDGDAELLKGAIFLDKPFSCDMLLRHAADALRSSPSMPLIPQTADRASL
jgi:signal transduction histidine kinase/CheY-like chemotaxis protein